MNAYSIHGFRVIDFNALSQESTDWNLSNVTLVILGSNCFNQASEMTMRLLKPMRIILCSDNVSLNDAQYILNKCKTNNLFHCHLFDCKNAKIRHNKFCAALEFNEMMQLSDDEMILYPKDDLDFDYIIKKALKHFGEIKKEAVEYEWVSSKQEDNELYNIYVVKIILNNGSVHVLNNLLCSKLIQTFEKLEKLNYKQLRGYILTSNIETRKLKNKRPIYCAGLDIKLFAQRNIDLIVDYFVNLRKMAYLMHTLKRPIIAGINGDCIAGGVELVIKCDYRIMYKTYKMQYNEAKNGVKLGSFPETLQRVIPNEDTLSFIFQTSLPFYGYDAKRIGFVNQIIDIDPKNDHKDKALINECLNVLENKYFRLAKPETAAQIRRLLRQKYIGLTKNVDKQKLRESLTKSFISSNFAQKSKL